MKKVGGFCAIGLLVSMTLVGCGSDGASSSGGAGAAPDFVALEGRLTQPSGTFAAGQEGAVQDAFGTQSTAAQGNPFGGGSGGTTTTKSVSLSPQSLHILAGAGDCAGLTSGGGKGSCACSNGGSIDFDVPAGAAGQPAQATGSIDQTISINAHACVEGAQTVDGSIFYKVKSPPPMQLFSVHLNMTGTKTARYDVDYLLKDGVITFAVDVADGRVLVSAKGNWNQATKSGTLVVTDKNDTWTCTLTSGKGTCTSAKGATRNVG
jgi:hypothetical protein